MRKGFTLVEIMIVVAIIVLLAAIAIPNLLRARINANQAAAAAAVHTISTAAQSFRSVETAYPEALASFTATNPPYIDTTLANGTKQGYQYSISAASTDANNFLAVAVPQTADSGQRSFFVDESGVMRYSNTAETIANTIANGANWSPVE